MKETFVKEIVPVDLNNPVLVEGLPGLGLVGKIAVRYLIRQLKAEKFAGLYSPHFPYFVLVGKKGSVRFLSGAFYYWKDKNGRNDLVFFTGDSQAQTIEGQYEISDGLLGFAEKHTVRMIVTIGGYRIETKDKPKVFAAATNKQLLEKALQGGHYQSSGKSYRGYSRPSVGHGAFQEDRGSLSVRRDQRILARPGGCQKRIGDTVFDVRV